MKPERAEKRWVTTDQGREAMGVEVRTLLTAVESGQR